MGVNVAAVGESKIVIGKFERYEPTNYLSAGKGVPIRRNSNESQRKRAVRYTQKLFIFRPLTVES